MTKEDLIKELIPDDLHHLISPIIELDPDKDDVVICMGSADGGWDNIEHVTKKGAIVTIVFGGGSPFSGE
ncbi:MAG: hypothetical protein GY804_09135 [Alphaproteobacteria bacterium]|nr:hypothetical protein [Alphaproteobacteria bacterium]